MIILSIIIAKNTHSITIVELCDRADIGVSADIAFNDQVENGNWADLKYSIEKKLKGNYCINETANTENNEFYIIKKYI